MTRRKCTPLKILICGIAFSPVLCIASYLVALCFDPRLANLIAALAFGVGPELLR